MMTPKPSHPTAGLGVIVGRFQTPFLSEAHVDLIRTVAARHAKILIVLGVGPALVTRRNPLPFEARKQMLLEAFPEATVLPLKDGPSDAAWSRRLDELISDTFPTDDAMLYGGRDGFVASYSGRHSATELESPARASGTALREEAARRARNSQDFRAGVVFAAFHQYPKCFPTVDVAIFSEDGTRLLLARKEAESDFRFIGGFADPDSPCYEADARREVQEETGVEITEPEYVGSLLVDDWRYRGEVDKIKSLLFRARLVSGRPQAQDDIAEVRWFDVAKLTDADFIPTHRPLWALLRGRGSHGGTENTEANPRV